MDWPAPAAELHIHHLPTGAFVLTGAAGKADWTLCTELHSGSAVQKIDIYEDLGAPLGL